MIVEREVNGKPAIIAFIDDNFEPCDEDVATLAKVIYDDGSVEFISLATEEAQQRIAETQ